MKRIVLDQGLPPAAALILRADQWDAVHVRELGMRESADSEIVAYGAGESRVVITLDRVSRKSWPSRQRIGHRSFSFVRNGCEALKLRPCFDPYGFNTKRSSIEDASSK